MRPMRVSLVTAAALSVLVLSADGADATFSIVAVDPATGEVGGAGASCIANSFIINDLIEGVGAIHTQALYIGCNQVRAHDRMIAGDSPDEIILYMSTNDCNIPLCGMNPCNETHRQYAVVDLDPVSGLGRSAGWTGSANGFYANHVLGPDYSIAGNILIDPGTYDVLAQMEQAFLNSTGTLAERLMAALQGANVPSADSRCTGRPAQSAFVKVVRPGGDPAAPYLELNVSNTISSENPVDILQGLFDAEPEPSFSSVQVLDDRLYGRQPRQTEVRIDVRNYGDAGISGKNVVITNADPAIGSVGPVTDEGFGIYSATYTTNAVNGLDTLTVTVDGNAGPVTLDDAPTIVVRRRRGDDTSDGGSGCGSLAPLGADLWSRLGGLLPLALVLLVLLVPARRLRAAFAAA